MRANATRCPPASTTATDTRACSASAAARAARQRASASASFKSRAIGSGQRRGVRRVRPARDVCAHRARSGSPGEVFGRLVLRRWLLAVGLPFGLVDPAVGRARATSVAKSAEPCVHVLSSLYEALNREPVL